MNRVRTISFRLLLVSLVLCSFFAAATLAQTASPTATPPPDPNAGNPFAPQKPPPLPPGMTGSNPRDPRTQLKPGMYDAGEAASGMRHITLLKKPDAFTLP